MKIAAITMAYNESFFLPIWLKHYGSTLGIGYENLYVIDDGSDDQSTNDLRIINRLRISKKKPFDEFQRASLVSNFHAELLNHYEYVLYADADELIVIDPNIPLNLYDYIKDVKNSVIAPMGFNVVHNFDSEPLIDLKIPLFHQRNFIISDFAYTKPLIADRKINWVPGFHGSDLERNISKHLFLFHLKFVDVGISEKRHNRLKRLIMSQSMKERNMNPDWGNDFVPYKNDNFINAIEMEPVDIVIKNSQSNKLDDVLPYKIPQRFKDCIHLDSSIIANEKIVPKNELNYIFYRSLEKSRVS